MNALTAICVTFILLVDVCFLILKMLQYLEFETEEGVDPVSTDCLAL